MTVEEIFTQIANHMQEGVKYHCAFSHAFDFLGLWGFAHCHNSHQFEEEKNLKQILHYYITHYFQLLQSENTTIKVIPDTWYKYHAQAVDVNTRRNAVKELMIKWIEWEKSTKSLYENLRQELISIKEIDAALELDKYIRDVSKELSHAQKKLLVLESHNYDMSVIIDDSNTMLKKYKKKLGW